MISLPSFFVGYCIYFLISVPLGLKLLCSQKGFLNKYHSECLQGCPDLLERGGGAGQNFLLKPFLPIKVKQGNFILFYSILTSPPACCKLPQLPSPLAQHASIGALLPCSHFTIPVRVMAFHSSEVIAPSCDACPG